MILLFALLSRPVLADPGRTLAGLTVGSTTTALSLRGHLDHGLRRHLTGRVEAGLLTGSGPGRTVLLSAGPQLDLIDTTWWRIGLTAMPELVVTDAVTVQARAGLRVDWLLFWGLCLSGRADRTQGLDGSGWDGGGWDGGGWDGGGWDGGLGLSVRL